MDARKHTKSERMGTSSKILGHWIDRLEFEKDRIRDYLNLKKEGGLILQKSDRLVQNFYKEIGLVECPQVKLNSIVQFIPTRLRYCQRYENLVPVLSVCPNEITFHQSQSIDDTCLITVSPLMRPCMRSCFIIRNACPNSDADEEEEVLRYGQDFFIQIYAYIDEPILVFSTPRSQNFQNVINSPYCDYQSFIPLGLISAKNTGAGGGVPLGHCRWRCLPLCNEDRIFLEGEPVPANKEMIILHPSTNQHLSAENTIACTLFGSECLPGVWSHYDVYHREQWQNIWIISNKNKYDDLIQ